MLNDETEKLIDQVKATQNQLSALLESVASDQDWQPDPGQWSFRYIAAHLATVDNECYKDRVVRIASGENPFFESYFNSGRDFSQFDLRDSLREWAIVRQEIVNLVHAVPDERQSLTGTHAAFGKITVLDVLRMMFDHDREHIQDLEQVIGRYKQA